MNLTQPVKFRVEGSVFTRGRNTSGQASTAVVGTTLGDTFMPQALSAIFKNMDFFAVTRSGTSTTVSGVPDQVTKHMSGGELPGELATRLEVKREGEGRVSFPIREGEPSA